MFLVPKPGVNKWSVIIDLRQLNTYCSEYNPTCETLEHLRHMSRPNDHFYSLDLVATICSAFAKLTDTTSPSTTAASCGVAHVYQWAGHARLTTFASSLRWQRTKPRHLNTRPFPTFLAQCAMARPPATSLHGRLPLLGQLLYGGITGPHSRGRPPYKTLATPKPDEGYLDTHLSRYPPRAHHRPLAMRIPSPGRQATRLSRTSLIRTRPRSP
jgi:hypothetical protein